MLKKIVLTAVVLTVMQTPAQAQSVFSPEQSAEIKSMIEAYIHENPDIMIASLEAYREKQQEEQEKLAADVLNKNMDMLTGADAPSVGNPDGDVVVVEFFDYNCGYCKRALSDIQAVVKNDQNVRFVFREMPILGPTSLTAAQWALAAHKQGKYFEYHVALMEHRGPKDEETLAKLAADTGLDVERMKKDAVSPDVNEQIAADLGLAREIGIQGTPAFIVDGELFRGYIGEEGLKASIETARKKSDS